jgi:hypothetical protein
MNKNLDRIEEHLRIMFEQSLPKIFIGSQSKLTLIENLMIVMRENLHKDIDGEIHAPDQFDIEVSPDDINEWQVHQDILNNIAETIHSLGEKEGFVFSNLPKISVQPNSTLEKHQTIVTAKINDSLSQLPDTAAMAQSERDPGSSFIPENALLIIDGKTNYPLEKEVINIGRHSENDLVLDDLHVSRHHAQLRAINHHFVIFDAGSTGGIFLNDRQISQATLQTGDVIRVGLINLIYVQDSTNGYATKAVSAEKENDYTET